MTLPSGLPRTTTTYNDPYPPDDNLPYYYTLAQITSHTNESGHTVVFYDHPRRLLKDGTYWNAEWSLVGKDSNGNYIPIATISYGFSITGTNVNLIPATPVLNPSYFQENSIY